MPATGESHLQAYMGSSRDTGIEGGPLGRMNNGGAQWWCVSKESIVPSLTHQLDHVSVLSPEMVDDDRSLSSHNTGAQVENYTNNSEQHGDNITHFDDSPWNVRELIKPTARRIEAFEQLDSKWCGDVRGARYSVDSYEDEFQYNTNRRMSDPLISYNIDGHQPSVDLQLPGECMRARSAVWTILIVLEEVSFCP